MNKCLFKCFFSFFCLAIFLSPSFASPFNIPRYLYLIAEGPSLSAPVVKKFQITKKIYETLKWDARSGVQTQIDCSYTNDVVNFNFYFVYGQVIVSIFNIKDEADEGSSEGIYSWNRNEDFFVGMSGRTHFAYFLGRAQYEKLRSTNRYFPPFEKVDIIPVSWTDPEEDRKDEMKCLFSKQIE